MGLDKPPIGLCPLSTKLGRESGTSACWSPKSGHNPAPSGAEAAASRGPGRPGKVQPTRKLEAHPAGVAVWGKHARAHPAGRDKLSPSWGLLRSPSGRHRHRGEPSSDFTGPGGAARVWEPAPTAWAAPPPGDALGQPWPGTPCLPVTLSPVRAA